MLRNGYDETNGVVIGGDFYTGKVYYDGRCLTSFKHFAETEEELMEWARTIKHRAIEEAALTWGNLYPDDSKWELRIY
jgi:hypothetical protein